MTDTTMNTGAASLLPCPFCGSKNTTIGYSGQPARAVFAMCSACGSSGPVQAFHRGMTFDWEECWNRRATPASQADAAIAAGGAQESIYQLQQVNGAWLDVSKSKFDAIACNYGRVVYAAPLPRVAPTVAVTDEQIVSIWEGMPDGASGFRKSWGYMQFARALLSASNGEQA